MLVLLLLSAVGCASPAEEEGGGATEDEIQAGAGRRSGLVQGIYDGKSASLEIVETPDRKQLATLYFDDGSSSGGGYVDVSLLNGEVTVGDSIDRVKKCELTIETDRGVRLAGTCAGKTINEEVVLRTPAAFKGSYTCTEKRNADAARVTISSATAAGVELRAEAIRPGSRLNGTANGRWSTAGLAFGTGKWNFRMHRPGKLAWQPQYKVGPSGVPVMDDGSPIDYSAGGVCTLDQ